MSEVQLGILKCAEDELNELNRQTRTLLNNGAHHPRGDVGETVSEKRKGRKRTDWRKGLRGN